MFSLDGYRALRPTAASSGGSIAAFWPWPAAIGRPGCRACVTNDVESLTDGQSCYAAYLTPQGRMITDMNVIGARARLLLDVPAPLAASLRDRLDGLIFTEDVQVTDESATLAVWTVIRARTASTT